MKHLMIFIAILVIGMGWVSFAISFNLYRKNKLKYLKIHNVSIAIFNYHLFCSFLYTYAKTNITGLKNNELFKIISELFLLQVSIVIVILIYVLIEFFYMLQREEWNKIIKNIFLIFYIVLILSQIMSSFLPQSKQSTIFFNYVLLIIVFSSHFIAVFFSIRSIIKNFPKLNKNQMIVLKKFGSLIFVIVSISLFVQTTSFFSIIGSKLNGFLTILPVFLINLFSLLFIKDLMKKMFPEQFLKNNSKDDIETVYAKYNISKREKDIVLLVCKGKSNKEIENELFISIPTIKEHISNIYKKTGVKNRVQLSNLF